MRTQTFDRERTSYPHLLVIGVRFVVEIFELGFGGDGGIDLLLASNARFPPFGMKLLCFLGP